jgi:hypothetical protein
VEQVNTKPDWELTRPPITNVPVQTTVRLSVYIHFTSIAGTAHVYVTTRVLHAGREIFRAGLTEDRGSPGNLWDHWNFTPTATGKYSLRASVTASGQTARMSAGFVAHSVPITFTFDRLQTFRTNGQPAIIFRRQERILIVSTYTIRHATAAVPVTAVQNLEAPTASGFKPLGKPVANIFDAGNGQHRYTVSFVPQGTYTLLRMVIDLTVAGQTREKAVTFEIRG